MQLHIKSLLILLSIFLPIFAFGQFKIHGTVIDKDTGDPLIGVNVILKESPSQGTISDYDGSFHLEISEIPTTLNISYIGYSPQDIIINNPKDKISIKLSEDVVTLDVGVEVTGQRVSEKQKAAPLTVESMDILAIKETPSENFYDGLGSLKGVDLTAASLGMKIINTRGFNSTSPVRSLQIIDGVDNQSPGLNFSLGNFLGASELDLQKVDLVVGASSAYYGPGAFNGVVAMTTKDPFIHQGVAASFKIGERAMYKTAVRYSTAFKNKKEEEFMAMKINLFYFQADDWVADNYGPVDNTISPSTNPGGFDAVNIYGDEYKSNFDFRKSDKLGMGIIHRPGYKEIDLVDYDSYNYKGSLAFHFRLQPNKTYESPEIVLQTNTGGGTTVYQGDNRFSLKNIKFFQHRIELRKKDSYFLRAYLTHEDAGDSYDPYFTALKIQEGAKSNEEWQKNYSNYWGAKINPIVRGMEGFPSIIDYIGKPDEYKKATEDFFAPLTDSLNIWHGRASDFAAAQTQNGGAFLEPGTPEFQAAFDSITSRIAYSEDGTRFFDRSALAHVHGEYKFNDLISTNLVPDLDMVVGSNYRKYLPNSNGSILIDTAGNNIDNFEYGLYVGATGNLFTEKLKLHATGRMDKHQNFNYLFSQALSMVYNPTQNQYFRMSFSSGIRNPTLAEQYLFYNVGPAILIGNIDGVQDLLTVESLIDYTNSNDTSVLVYFDVPAIKPEKVKSFEVGYRTTLWDKVYVDGEYYYNSYKDFIGYLIGVDASYSSAIGGITRAQGYRVSANATDVVTTQGASIGINYYFGKKYMVKGNYSWNVLNTKTDDPIVPAYNTPENKFNLGFSGRGINMDLGAFILKNVGFNINYKWIEGFLFEGSPQFTGQIPSYGLLDCQINWHSKKWDTTFKIGASNILNNKVNQTYGGPKIGRLAYFSVLYDWKKR